MSTQHILVIVATTMFLIPFGIWTVIRFRIKVMQKFSSWHKLVVITSFSVFEPGFIILMALALTVFAP